MGEADERESPTNAQDDTGTEVDGTSASDSGDESEALEPDLSALAHPSAAPADDDEAGLLDLSAFRAAAGKVESPAPAPPAPAAPVPVVGEAPQQGITPVRQGGSGTPIILAGLFIGAGIALGGYFLKGEPADVARAPLSASESTSTSMSTSTTTGGDEQPGARAVPPAAAPQAEAGGGTPDDTAEASSETQGSVGSDALETGSEGATSRAGSGAAPAAAGSRMASGPRAASTMAASAAMSSASMSVSVSMASAASMATTSMQRTERDLLAAALGDRASAMSEMPAPEMAEAAPALPEEPSRADVRRALSPLMPAIRRCAQDQVGVATARIRVRSNGSVESATIGGSPFGGTPQGECMARAVRRAHFRPFRRPSYSLSFPFAIRPR